MNTHSDTPDSAFPTSVAAARVGRSSRGRFGVLLSAVVVVAVTTVVIAAPATARQTGAGSSSVRSTPEVRTTTLWFDRFDDRHGMTSGDTNAFVVDENGFLWIGTDNGINRYDGYSFKKYEHDPNDPNSLYDTTVYDLAIGPDGIIWIATFSGIERFDPATEQFRRIGRTDSANGLLPNAEYSEIAIDTTGAVWVGSGVGLFRINPKTEAVRAYEANEADTTALVHQDVDHLLVTRDGTLWIGTGKNGLHTYNPASDSFQRVYVVPPTYYESDGFATIVEDEADALWLGSWGLHKLDPVTGNVQSWLPEPNEPVASFDNVNNYISSIHSDGEMIWVATFANGLFLFDPGREEFTHYKPNANDDTSLPSFEVAAIIGDPEGNVWIGTEEGMARVPANRRNIVRITASGVAGQNKVVETPGRILWLPFNETLIRYNLDTGSTRSIPYSNVGAGFTSPYNALLRLPSRPNSVFSGTDGGTLLEFDENGNEIDKHVVQPLTDREFLSVMTAVELREQPGTVWAPTYQSGLCSVHLDRRDQWCTDELPNIMTLAEDIENPGVLWVGSNYQGLYRFDTATRTVTNQYRPDPDDTTSIAIDFIQALHASRSHPGTLWIGYWTGGLDRFDTATGRVVKSYTSQNSALPDNIVGALSETDDGALWASSSRGLVRIDQETGALYDYSSTLGAGLGGRGHALTDDGHLLVRAKSVTYRFRPQDITGQPVAPPVVLTAFRIRDTPVRPGPDSPLSAPINRADEVTLPYGDRDFSIDYVALDFGDAESIRYEYLLEGYDETWQTGGDVRRATYTNLPPGRYTFRVRATSGAGLRDADGASVRVTVLPPWWRTVWAYLAYALLFVAGVFAVDRVQRRRVLRAERERARERELEQAREIERAYNELRIAKDRLVQQEKLASLGQLAAGIAHEIKNPLNFVNNFSELNQELMGELREVVSGNGGLTGGGGTGVGSGLGTGDAKLLAELLDDLEENARMIGEHGRRADGIVRSMMEHASASSGERVETDVNALVGEYVELAYHGKHARVSDFAVRVERDFGSDVGSVELVQKDIGRVLTNLLDNAFDAVMERAAAPTGEDRGGGAAVADGSDYVPTVRIETRRVGGGAVTIRIIDNGLGVPEDIREKVFEPFYTTKQTGAQTGLGLSLSHDIVVQGHGGMLELSDVPGGGAAFTITLPA